MLSTSFACRIKNCIWYRCLRFSRVRFLMVWWSVSIGENVKKWKIEDIWNNKSRPRPLLSDRSYGVSMIDFNEMSIRSIFVGHIVDILFWSPILVNLEKKNGTRHQAKPRRWPFLGICCFFLTFFLKILTPGIRRSLCGGLFWGFQAP